MTAGFDASRSQRRALAALLLSIAWPGTAIAVELRVANAQVEPHAGLSPEAALERFGGGEGVWIGWSVAGLADVDSYCCYRERGGLRSCSLADEHEGWSTSDANAAGDRQTGSTVLVMARARAGAIVDLRLLSPDCPLDGAGRRIVWIGQSSTAASIDLLETLLAGRGDEPGPSDRRARGDRRSRALAAIAAHDDPRADRILERRALDRRLDDDAREEALFWAGQLRGETGYRLLDRILTDEPEPDLRAHATFALTLSSVPAALARVRRAAVDDRSPDVRAQALFWLGQSDDPGAGAWIVGRLDGETDDEVREQAVFALAQLDDGADWLITLLRTRREPEIVRQALFWLGQSDDPRAMAELEKILIR